MGFINGLMGDRRMREKGKKIRVHQNVTTGLMKKQEQEKGVKKMGEI